MTGAPAPSRWLAWTPKAAKYSANPGSRGDKTDKSPAPGGFVSSVGDSSAETQNISPPAATTLADSERRFGPGSGYLALLGRRVMTPRGAGVVVQVFRDRLTVAFGENGAPSKVVSFFRPNDVEVTP